MSGNPLIKSKKIFTVALTIRLSKNWPRCSKTNPAAAERSQNKRSGFLAVAKLVKGIEKEAYFLK